MIITLDTLISIPDGVYTQEIGDETILLDTQGGNYFGLDPVGTHMWQLIRQRGALRPAYDVILTEYNVAPERLEADLLALADKLVEKGLVVIQTARGPFEK